MSGGTSVPFVLLIPKCEPVELVGKPKAKNPKMEDFTFSRDWL